MKERYKYPVLMKKIHERGIKRTKLCEILGISLRTFSYKINKNSTTDFSWKQAKTIRKIFFPDISMDELFADE